MHRARPACSVLAVLALLAGPAVGSTAQRDTAPAEPAPAVYLELDASVLLVTPDFAADLKLDPSPIDALLESDATLIAMPGHTGQLLADAAAMHPDARLLRAPVAVTRDGQTVATLIAAEPALVAMPFDLSEAFAPANAPEGMVALLVVRASIIRDGIVEAPSIEDPIDA